MFYRAFEPYAKIQEDETSTGHVRTRQVMCEHRTRLGVPLGGSLYYDNDSSLWRSIYGALYAGKLLSA